MKQKCIKCECHKCRTEIKTNIKLGDGCFYLGPDLCYDNKIKVFRNKVEITSQCVGLVMLEPKYFEDLKESR